MREFKDKVAVITGAASGLGRAMADRCVQEGMKVVLADVEVEELAKTEASMKASGATVLALRTDVSQASDMEALAQKTLEAFGAVHLLCNNAGVGTDAAIWKSTIADWEWVIGVNLWGVIHGVRIFVPIMLKQDTESHIVNTASMAGLISGPGLGAYKVTKHAVVALSETLYHELAERGQESTSRCSVLGLSAPGSWSQRETARGTSRRRSHASKRPQRGGKLSASAWRLGCLLGKLPIRSLRRSGKTSSTSSRTQSGKIQFAREWKTSSRAVIRPLPAVTASAAPGQVQ